MFAVFTSFLVLLVLKFWFRNGSSNVALQIQNKKNSSSKLVRVKSVLHSQMLTPTLGKAHTCMQRLTGSATTELTFVPVPGEKKRKNANPPYTTKHSIGTPLSRDSSSWCSLRLICCKKLNVASDIIHARLIATKDRQSWSG